MDKKPQIYICGPLFSSGVVSQNIREAYKISMVIRMAGLLPQIPHHNFFLDLAFPREESFWMEWDLDQLRHCQGVFRLEGASSPNIEVELALATSLQIPIFTVMYKLMEYFNCVEEP